MKNTTLKHLAYQALKSGRVNTAILISKLSKRA